MLMIAAIVVSPATLGLFIVVIVFAAVVYLVPPFLALSGLAGGRKSFFLAALILVGYAGGGYAARWAFLQGLQYAPDATASASAFAGAVVGAWLGVGVAVVVVLLAEKRNRAVEQSAAPRPDPHKPSDYEQQFIDAGFSPAHAKRRKDDYRREYAWRTRKPIRATAYTGKDISTGEFPLWDEWEGSGSEFSFSEWLAQRRRSTGD